MKLALNAMIAILITIGLLASKSWRFDPADCGKNTFQQAHSFDQKLWMVIDILVLLALVALIYVCFQEGHTQHASFYVLTLVAFLAMKINHMKASDQINKGDCKARIQDLWVGTLVDGWLLGMTILYIFQNLETPKA